MYVIILTTEKCIYGKSEKTNCLFLLKISVDLELIEDILEHQAKR